MMKGEEMTNADMVSPGELGIGGVVVPAEIDRAKHGHVLLVWNDCMANQETLEMTWPKLVKAMRST